MPTEPISQQFPAPPVPGGAAAVLAPFAILLGVSVYLHARWKTIPERFPIHWDLAGHANGWSTRTFGGVYGPLFIALAVLASLAAMIAFSRSSAKRGPIGSSVYRRNRAMFGSLVLVMWTIAIAFSMASLSPLILVDGRFPIPLPVMVLVPVGIAIAAVWWVARAFSAPDDSPSDAPPADCWKWGVFYYNPADSSVMVEKRFGIGYTLNYARWESWAITGILLAPLPVILLIVRHH